MTLDTFLETLLVLGMAALIVERSLAVVFETRFYIHKLGHIEILKPLIAIFYAMFVVAISDMNVAKILNPELATPDAGTTFAWTLSIREALQNLGIIVISGLCIAGGSKVYLKVFRDYFEIRSSDEAQRLSQTKPGPANPVKAALQASNDNTDASELLNNMFDESRIPKANQV